MSKVLLLGNSDLVIYNFRMELVERLLADGHHVVISAPYGERIEELTRIGCEYHDIKLSRHGINPLEELELIRTYRKLMKQVRPDIIFSYTIKPNLYGAIAARQLKIPFIANITGLGTAVEYDGILQKVTVLLYKFAFSSVHRVFFQNEENKQFFVERKIACGKHGLLPGSGVNLSRFHPMPYPSSDKIEFAFISRIMKEKGIDQYLDAAQYIRRKYPNTVFHICGFCEQDYEQRLRELEAEGVIVYHGMLRDIRTILPELHCTIHPTYYPEGMSNTLLETCACARPIITTDRAGCREIVDDGVNGFVCAQRDSGDLIAKIERFMQLSHEQREEMGRQARLKVERCFDRQIVVEKYMMEVRNLGRVQESVKK